MLAMMIALNIEISMIRVVSWRGNFRMALLWSMQRRKVTCISSPVSRPTFIFPDRRCRVLLWRRCRRGSDVAAVCDSNLVFGKFMAFLWRVDPISVLVGEVIFQLLGFTFQYRLQKNQTVARRISKGYPTKTAANITKNVHFGNDNSGTLQPAWLVQHHKHVCCKELTAHM